MDVSGALSQQTTKSGKVRQRIKWTDNMNICVMRHYYRITLLETRIIGYRQELHQAFRREYPLIDVTEQRVADQRRVIIKNNMLAVDTLNTIRREVENELQIDQENEEPAATDDTSSNSEDDRTDDQLLRDLPDVDPPIPEDDHITQEMPQTPVSTMPEGNSTENTPEIDDLKNILNLAFSNALSEFAHLDPTNRPRIPKPKQSKQMDLVIHVMNAYILLDYAKKRELSFEEIHAAVYCGAVAVVRRLGSKIKLTNSPSTRIRQVPKWEQRLVLRIGEFRRDIGRLEQLKRGNRSKKVAKYCQDIFERFKIHTRHETPNEITEEYLDTLKQKLSALAKRLCRYKACTDRKNQNRMFKEREKQFYQQLNDTEEIVGNGTPSKIEIEDFWAGIWSNPLTHNPNATWIQDESDRMNHVEEMKYDDISIYEVKAAIRNTHNWKAPGIDNVQNVWYKKFSALHTQITRCLNEFVSGEKDVPDFFTEGITFLKPKDNDTINPSKYRPITCLPTIYKILTSCITTKVYSHCEEHNIIAEEQKGCRKFSQGCKEQLIIDSTIMNQAFQKKRNIHVSYIDYKKAYDSSPHSWLIQVLEIYKVNPILVKFLKTIMTNWRTTLKLNIGKEQITSDPVKIRRGIFQGDSLSALWFCLSINPLSNILNKASQTHGFKIKDDSRTCHIVSHLFYMDDLKLYAANLSHLTSLLNTTLEFSQDICMEFGVDKCKSLHITRGKITHSEEFEIDNDRRIGVMEEEDVYKYLGFTQAQRIDHKSMKVKMIETYKKRLGLILKTQLTGKNKIAAINTYAVPVLAYSFGIIKWTQTDIHALEILTRTTLTKHRMHHPKSAIERVTLPREKGGRGLTDLNNLYHKQMEILRKYFRTKSTVSQLHRAIVLADKSLTPLNLYGDNINIEQRLNSDAAKEVRLLQKSLHSRHYNELHKEHVDLVASNKWLKIGDIFGETEGFMMAIQDKVIMTNNYKKHIIKDATVEDKCRKCSNTGETIEHIVSGCPMLCQTDYLHRHNQVANIIHQKLAIKYKLLQTSTAYYKYKPEKVLDSKDFKLYYDRAVITDQTIHHNRPDIIIIDKKKRETIIIDVAVPLCHNVEKTWIEKISKYKELAIEIKKMWKQTKVTVVPLIISANGIVPRKLHDSIKTIDLQPNIYIEMQKAIILNTCRIVRKFFNIEET
jgi:Reverse transcriptase (RNA-dependent DNA polymerase)